MNGSAQAARPPFGNAEDAARTLLLVCERGGVPSPDLGAAADAAFARAGYRAGDTIVRVPRPAGGQWIVRRHAMGGTECGYLHYGLAREEWPPPSAAHEERRAV